MLLKKDKKMARFVEIKDLGAPELDVFVRLTGAQLRNKLEPEKGIFIAESPTVIEVALHRPKSAKTAGHLKLEIRV